MRAAAESFLGPIRAVLRCGGRVRPPGTVFKSPHAKKLELRVNRPNTILGHHATSMSASTEIANMYPERL